jgi:hypothetical protein
MPLPRLTVPSAGRSDGPRELCPAENMRAKIIRIYFVGTQENTFEPNQKPVPKLVITFEADSQKSDGTNHLLSMVVTYSLHEKSSLTKQFGSILGDKWPTKPGQSFDIAELVGLDCMVDVVHSAKKDGTLSAKIGKIGKLPRGFQPLESDMDQFLWSFDDPGAMNDEKVPEWIRKMASESIEVTGRVVQMAKPALATRGHAVNPDADDSPF